MPNPPETSAPPSNCAMADCTGPGSIARMRATCVWLPTPRLPGDRASMNRENRRRRELVVSSRDGRRVCAVLKMFAPVVDAMPDRVGPAVDLGLLQSQRQPFHVNPGGCRRLSRGHRTENVASVRRFCDERRCDPAHLLRMVGGG